MAKSKEKTVEVVALKGAKHLVENEVYSVSEEIAKILIGKKYAKKKA